MDANKSRDGTYHDDLSYLSATVMWPFHGAALSR